MHQPYYKDRLTGRYSLPWVRLHAAKDYLHMAEVLSEFPNVHVTFDVVPCLLAQIQDYLAGQAEDEALALSRREHLSRENKEAILSFFFDIHHDNIIRRYPHYWKLLQMRQASSGDVSLLSSQYFLDLIAWFNLAWIDPNWLERDVILRQLIDKGANFTRADIEAILEAQRRIMARIVPLYRELRDRGQLELATAPYYHPILPLVIDVQSAREASPKLPLPETAFAHPEDAAEQIRRAIDYHEDVFGERPKGMWPSEGAVSQALVDLLGSTNGLRWIASDEGVLARSLGVDIGRDNMGHVTNPQVLYQPYLLTQAERRPDQPSLAIIFRDRILSDRIGFVYKHTTGQDAANDLIGRLETIHRNLGDDGPYLVTIILDGENAWEEYEHNGDLFLRALYGRLNEHPNLRAVTVSEYLDMHPPRQSIKRLFAGSWINANFETWIGEGSQNLAWDYLARTRQRLINWQRENNLADVGVLADAWEEIYIAEGSDWFWWYYSYNSSAQEARFDHDFRAHLSNVYTILGLPVPEDLRKPIAAEVIVHRRPVSGYISPRLGSEAVASADWGGAGYLDPMPSSGAMQQARTVVRRLYFGYDPAHLYLRLETNEPLSDYFVAFYLTVPRAERVNGQVRFAVPSTSVQGSALADLGLAWELARWPSQHEVTLSRADGQEVWRPVHYRPAAVVGSEVLEVQVALGELGLALGDPVGLLVSLARGEALVETLPRGEAHTFTLVKLA